MGIFNYFVKKSPTVDPSKSGSVPSLNGGSVNIESSDITPVSSPERALYQKVSKGPKPVSRTPSAAVTPVQSNSGSAANSVSGFSISDPQTHTYVPLSKQVSRQESRTSVDTSASATGGSNSVSSASNPNPSAYRRVQCLQDGTHVHILKNTRRQEKLRRMLRDVMGGSMKVDNKAVSAVPDFVKQVDKHADGKEGGNRLTLMHGLVNKLATQGSIDPSKPGDICSSPSPNVREDTLKSLVEKYGKCQEVIGRGSYGVVRIAHKQVGGREQLFAVKEFKRRSSENNTTYEDRLMSEFCISSSLDHVNINRTFDLMKDANGGCCQIMEYCAGGDLYSLVLSTGTGLTEIEANCFFKQILRGIIYMHSMGVAHCDIKPENILLTQNGVCKISDFGNGECFRMAWEKEVHFSRGVCGSKPYIAPEEYKSKSFDPRAADIWALGVVYMVMRTGSYLWRMASVEEDDHYAKYISDRKTETGFAPIERLSPSKSVYVVYSILDPVPSRRITGKQILNSEWCRGIKVCQAAECKDRAVNPEDIVSTQLQVTLQPTKA